VIRNADNRSRGRTRDSTASTSRSDGWKLSAAGIVAKARKAAGQASAVHVKGDITEDGERLRFDIRLLADRGGAGTLTVRGGSVRITRIGTRVYMKGDSAFWTATAGPAAAKLFVGKWLKGSTSEPDMAGLIFLTDIDTLMTQLFKDARGEGEVELVAWDRRRSLPGLARPKENDPSPAPMQLGEASRSGFVFVDELVETAGHDGPG
jgi:hypothetical protein